MWRRHFIHTQHSIHITFAHKRTQIVISTTGRQQNYSAAVKLSRRHAADKIKSSSQIKRDTTPAISLCNGDNGLRHSSLYPNSKTPANLWRKVAFPKDHHYRFSLTLIELSESILFPPHFPHLCSCPGSPRAVTHSTRPQLLGMLGKETKAGQLRHYALDPAARCLRPSLTSHLCIHTLFTHAHGAKATQGHSMMEGGLHAWLILGPL